MAKLTAGFKIVGMISIVFFATIIGVFGFVNLCNPRRQILHAAKNQALQNFAYMKTTLLSPVLCGRECSIDEHCRSFNFYERNKLCFLNNSTRAEHPHVFAETQGSVYFDTHAETPVFSVADKPLVHGGSCKELLEACNCTSGVYTIYPEGFIDGLEVYCDMETDGGGWIVFQRRQDGSEDFYRNWTDYKFGFGDLWGEFWLGNENLVSLTSDASRGKWELHVDLEDWDGRTGWAKYPDFKLSQGKYILIIGQYDASSTAGNSLGHSDGWPFSTRDNDNDLSSSNCAQDEKGAWWFVSCGSSNLNGPYKASGQIHGIFWSAFKGFFSLKKCSMKMREIGH